MCHMESKMQERYEHGEAKMKRFCEVVELMWPEMKRLGVDPNEFAEAVALFNQMGWDIYKSNEAE